MYIIYIILLTLSCMYTLHSCMLNLSVYIGRKWNILRKRVDTCIYDQSQLLFGTVLFTINIFLLPSFAIYYYYFMLVKCIFTIAQSILWCVSMFISDFPYYSVLLGVYMKCSGSYNMQLRVTRSAATTVSSSTAVCDVYTGVTPIEGHNSDHAYSSPPASPKNTTVNRLTSHLTQSPPSIKRSTQNSLLSRTSFRAMLDSVSLTHSARATTTATTPPSSSSSVSTNRCKTVPTLPIINTLSSTNHSLLKHTLGTSNGKRISKLSGQRNCHRNLLATGRPSPRLNRSITGEVSRLAAVREEADEEEDDSGNSSGSSSSSRGKDREQINGSCVAIKKLFDENDSIYDSSSSGSDEEEKGQNYDDFEWYNRHRRKRGGRKASLISRVAGSLHNHHNNSSTIAGVSDIATTGMGLLPRLQPSSASSSSSAADKRYNHKQPPPSSISAATTTHLSLDDMPITPLSLILTSYYYNYTVGATNKRLLRQALSGLAFGSPGFDTVLIEFTWVLYHHRVLRRMEALSSTTAAMASIVSLEKFIQASYSDAYSLSSPSIFESESVNYHSCSDDDGNNKDKKNEEEEGSNNSNKSSSSSSGNRHTHSKNLTNSKLRSDIQRGQYWSALIQLYHQHYINYNYGSNTQHAYDTHLYPLSDLSSDHRNTTSFSTSSGSSSGSLPIHIQAHNRLSRLLYTRLLLFMVFIVIIWVYGMYMFTTLVLPIHIYTSSYTIISYVYSCMYSCLYYMYSICTHVIGWLVYVSRAVYSSTDTW